MLVGGYVALGARRCNVDVIVESRLNCILFGAASMSAMNRDRQVCTGDGRDRGRYPVVAAVGRVGYCSFLRSVRIAGCRSVGDVASSVGPV